MVLRQLQIVSASKFPAALTHRMHIMTSPTSQLSLPQERVLLRELNHRISNEFCAAISVVSLAAARSSNKEVKAALTDVAELLDHYAEVHHALQMPEHGTRTDAAAYVRNLCLSIRRSKLNQMKIELVLAARRLWLQPERCWLLGMIIHELITNAARHAFAGGDGWIRVELFREGAFVECRVLDNGSAPLSLQPGRGLKIVQELTKALEGRFDQKFATGGSTSSVMFPSRSELQVTANRRTRARSQKRVAALRVESTADTAATTARIGTRNGAKFSYEAHPQEKQGSPWTKPQFLVASGQGGRSKLRKTDCRPGSM
jgi:two-component sensor histidine kinase